MLAAAFLLSSDFLKFSGFWAAGGGVTLCSMVPLVLLSFRWGWKWGCFAGFVYSLLQMLQGLDTVRYATGVGMAFLILLLDYLLAYTAVGFAGFFDGKLRRRPAAVALGTAVALGMRFLCHFLSGWLIWDALWPNGAGLSAPLYSLFYNGSYMLPEILQTSVVSALLLPALERTGKGGSSA